MESCSTTTALLAELDPPRPAVLQRLAGESSHEEAAAKVLGNAAWNLNCLPFAHARKREARPLLLPSEQAPMREVHCSSAALHVWLSAAGSWTWLLVALGGA